MTGTQDMTVMMGTGGSSGASAGGVMKPPKAKLICLDDSLLDSSQKGLEIFLDEGEITLGRGEENTHPIKYSKISRVHARIFPSEGKWGVEDLKSTNGVWINDVRVTMEPLKPGDYLRIGAIPFRFVLERPEAAGLAASGGGAAAPAGDSEHTMMFGSMSDARAADALMVANAEEEPVRAKPTSTATAQASSPSSSRSTPAKSKTPLMAAIGVGVLLVVGGLAFFLTRGPGGEEEASALRKKFKDFSYTYEEPSGTPSGADLTNAMAEISRIGEEVQQATEKFPKNFEFRGLAAKAIFLEMERNFYKMVKEGRTNRLPTLVDQASGRVTALNPGPGQPALEEVTQTLEVLSLAQSVATIKAFHQKFPDPSENASPKPTVDEFANYQEARDKFVGLKRNPRINSLLSVTYSFFGRIATSVDQSDLPQLDRWKEFVR